MNSTYFLAPQAQIDLAKIAPSYRKPGLEKSCAGNPAGTKLGAALHHQILSLKVVLFKGGRSAASRAMSGKACFKNLSSGNLRGNHLDFLK